MVLWEFTISIFVLPIVVKKRLESIRSKFFWGCENNQRGIGIGSLECFNYALLLKWRWRFHTEPESLWARVVMATQNSPVNYYESCVRSKENSIWANMVKSWIKLD